MHLLVLWSEARHAEAAIVAGGAASLRPLDSVEIEWSKEHFARSPTRLYGDALPPGSDKERHGGTGPFLLLVVRVATPGMTASGPAPAECSSRQACSMPGRGIGAGPAVGTGSTLA